MYNAFYSTKRTKITFMNIMDNSTSLFLNDLKWKTTIITQTHGTQTRSHYSDTVS